MAWKRPGQRRRDGVPESAAALTEGTGHRVAAGDADVVPLEVSHAQMNDAACAGAAVPLGPGLPWVARYLGAWWVEYEGGWLRVTDGDVAADLDDVAARLGEAAAIAEADEARRRHGPGADGGGRG